VIFLSLHKKNPAKIVPKDYSALKMLYPLFTLQDVYSQEITGNVHQWKDSLKSLSKIFTKNLFLCLVSGTSIPKCLIIL